MIKEEQIIPDAFQPDDWKSQSAIWRFKPNHIDFICEHYELLIAGKWPKKKTGYIDSPYDGRTQIKPYAEFENIMELIGEFHWRIDQCGDDGKLFRAVRLYKYDLELIKMIIGGRFDQDWVDRRCKCVRDYIKGIGKTGEDRRNQSYKEFCEHWWTGYYKGG